MGGNSANMIRKTSQYLLRLVEFNVQSNYFWLVDRLHVLFDLSIPPSTRPLVRNVWLTIKILTFLQYTHHMVQLFRTAFDSMATAEEFITIFNMCIVLTTALGRAACLAYHRSAILSLKGYINSKNCLRDDPLSFELRKATFVRNIKLTAVFTCYTTLNATYYYFTEFRTASVFRMPLPAEVFPARLSYCIETLSSVVGISWSVVLFISLTQFGTLLNSLCTELTVIVQQFDGMFEQVVANCALNTLELAESNENERTKFWRRLDSTFTNAISHHSSFVSHQQRLKSVSSINFFILLTSAALMITVNTFMFIIEPSLGRLPL
uniref:(northern house mosquito) hypothetical protein n=1 Tax=Culex pipiens TaxID=7175 RepID=A0A8D8B6Q1_CULPI